MAHASIRSRGTALLVLALFTSLTVSAQKFRKGEAPSSKNLPAVLWRDPGNVSSLDLFHGPGGKDHAPGSTYTFIKEDSGGTNPKFEVVDEKGVTWKIKLGREAQPETAATRLLWAAGFFADEDYYVDELRVAGLPKLRRGGKYTSPGGIVRGVRLERRLNQEDVGEWSWYENPFMSQREYNGLRVLMVLMNNWDLKDVNNSIHELEGERRYLATDVGATFGKTGSFFSRSKNELKDYENSKFIRRVDPDTVNLEFHSKTMLVMFFNPGAYHRRVQMEGLAKRIPRADAKWLGQRLALLSPDQIRDCFRAAGYSPEAVEGYTKAVQKRIAELNAL